MEEDRYAPLPLLRYVINEWPHMILIIFTLYINTFIFVFPDSQGKRTFTIVNQSSKHIEEWSEC